MMAARGTHAIETVSISLVQRIREEFEGSPGLQVTVDEAVRFWALDELTCEQVLTELLASGFLVRGVDGRYRQTSVATPLVSRGIHMGESIQQAIVREVSAWPGVSAGPHRFGGVELRFGQRELGHLHGNRLADLPFPLLVREELVTTGQAEPHRVFPDSGWVSVFIRDASDVRRVIALFRLNYERPWVDRPRKGPDRRSDLQVGRPS